MTTITPAGLEQYNFDETSTKTFNDELGQGEFLELMLAQLENQDPMEPMDNGEFLGQMAQFSTVSGIEEMTESMAALTETYATGQTLQSSQLVGQEVLIEDNTLELNAEDNASGVFELEASSGDVKLDITDITGSVVQQIDLGSYSAGRHVFSWDGMNKDGNPMPPGKYTANVTTLNDDSYESVPVLTSRIIDSVEFGAGGETKLNTKQGDDLTVSDIRQIRTINQ